MLTSAVASARDQPMDSRTLSQLYRRAHNRMRDIDGLHPQEALDELLKFFLVQESLEAQRPPHRNVPAEFLRHHFRSQIKQLSRSAAPLWKDAQLLLSDQTLLELRAIFSSVELTKLPLDIRSTALRTFLTPSIRRGLGIFLTPEDVARAMVEVAAPHPTETILDPACGSGTFLIEAARYMNDHGAPTAPLTLYGIDKSPRMLLLAELNFGGSQDLLFRGECMDSLRELGREDHPPLNLRRNSIDLILTNPPFGVTVTRELGVLDRLGPIQSNDDRVPSEIMFLELCLRLLRPNGRLGIVLPRSVLTNDRLTKFRSEIDNIGHLTHIVDLPTETFAATGTQTTTVAAFFRRHANKVPKRVMVRVCTITNVGIDTTGRKRTGNQLPLLSKHLADVSCKSPQADDAASTAQDNAAPTVFRSEVSANETLQNSAALLFRRPLHRVRTGQRTLQQFVEVANTGRTPARTKYAESGTFILKVGNLTGRGIDWTPRDRNFVSTAEGVRRRTNRHLSLEVGDLLLTASAHASKYIAKKSDVLAHVPNEYDSNGVTFVGELIRVRPHPDVDPFVLLAAIRHPDVRADMQASVRGQTAHLNPADMLAIGVPWDLRSPDSGLLTIASLLRRQADIAFDLYAISTDISLRLAQRRPR